MGSVSALHEQEVGSQNATCEGHRPKIMGTVRMTREQGRDMAAAHLRNAIEDINGQSCETVARSVGFSQRNIVSRQQLGHKPIQLGDVYAMPRSVAIRLLRSVLHDIEASPDARQTEAVALRACGSAAGLAARIAEMLSDGQIDEGEGAELRAKSRALVAELMTLSGKVS